MWSWLVGLKLLMVVATTVLLPSVAAAQLSPLNVAVGKPHKLIDGLPSCFRNISKRSVERYGANEFLYVWSAACNTSLYLCVYDPEGKWWDFTTGNSLNVPTAIHGRVLYFIETTTTWLEFESVKARCSRASADPTLASTAAMPAVSQLSDATRLAAINAFRAEWKAFSERYPNVPTWTEAEKEQYRVFMGTNALAILDRHKSNMEKEEYDTIAAPGLEMRARGRAACPACKAEYPVQQLVAGLDTPSAAMRRQHDEAVAFFEMEKQLRIIDANVAKVNSGLFGTLTATQPIHNRANDATSCVAVEPTGVKMEWGIEGRYRLRNTCGYPIAASWCANVQECGAGRGNLWTIPPGKDYPIYFADISNPNIQVGACKTGDAKAPPLGQQGVERTGFNAARDQPPAAPGVSLLASHRCE